jgi:ComF family protein
MADHAVVPLVHRGNAAHLIHRLKFNQGEPEGRALAHILLTHIRLKCPNRLPDLLVPVPMAYWPAVKRGFNQARLLADCLGRELDLPVAHTLLTRRLGPSQRSLSRAERRRTAPDNFRWRNETEQNALRGKHVAVVDDVMTTGATARQIIKLLRLHGAARVDVWCATRTPSLHQ